MASLKKNSIATLFLFPLIFFSCKSNQSTENVIKINSAQIQTLYMSDYFESIEYIQLETNDNCLIGINPVFYFTTEFIVTITPRSKECLVFNRITGKFIRKIGNVGQGPQDYSEIPSGIIVNEQAKTISFGRGDRLVEYSLTDGTWAPVETKVPRLLSNKLAYVAKDLWAIGLTNPTGNNPNQILFFNRYEMIDSIPNHFFFKPKRNIFTSNPYECLFYCYDNSVYYKNLYNDTIFKIVNRKLQPEWVFEMKTSTHLLSQLREDPFELGNEMVKFQLLNNALETDEFLLFDISYQKQKNFYLFDKKQRQLKELSNGKFINDLDGGLAFWPTNTNRNQDLICVFQTFFMKDEINVTNIKEEDVKNISDFRKLKTLVSHLNEEDNPIVVIAKLKK